MEDQGDFGSADLWAMNDPRPRWDPNRVEAVYLKSIRANAGLTWEQLGRLFGVSARLVQHWSVGAQMNDVHARNIRQAYRETVTDLRDEQDSKACCRKILGLDTGDWDNSIYRRLQKTFVMYEQIVD